MPDVSKFDYMGTPVDIKDAQARGDIAELKSATESLVEDVSINVEYSVPMEFGTYKATTGEKSNETQIRFRTAGYIPSSVKILRDTGTLYSGDSAGILVYAWEKDGTYVGFWTGSSFGTSGGVFIEEVDMDVFRTNYPDYKFAAVIQGRLNYPRKLIATVKDESFHFDDIKSQTDKIPFEKKMSLERGSFDSSTGGKSDVQQRGRSTNYVDENATRLIIRNSSDGMLLYAWDEDGTYIGFWGGSGWVKSGSQYLGKVDLVSLRKSYPTYRYKVVVIPASNILPDVIMLFDNSIESATRNQWYGKTWYGYGTSITNTDSEGKYPIYLAQMSGMTYVNKGISGGGIGNLGAYSRGQVYSAVCNVTDGKLDADLITLETGANDTGEDVPLGTIYDTGTQTLAGCLNDCIRYLLANTDAQICIINSPSSSTLPNATNKYYQWADMVRQICDINRVHFLNNNCNMGAAKLSDATKGSLYVVDSLHQTDLGGYIMAQNLWFQLRNIPLFYTAMPV